MVVKENRSNVACKNFTWDINDDDINTRQREKINCR